MSTDSFSSDALRVLTAEYGLSSRPFDAVELQWAERMTERVGVIRSELLRRWSESK